jgi:hypothetical protein
MPACQQRLCDKGDFAYDKSTTFNNTGQNFNIAYVIGSVEGVHILDTLQISGKQSNIKIPDASMGLALNTTSLANGIMGIGYESASVTKGKSILRILKESKIIDRMSYSLWLNDVGQYPTVIIA